MFNIEDFDIKLDTEFIGRNFLYSEQVDSTNAFLLKNPNYKMNGTVLLSEYQSKGRGRKQREWSSSADQNLTFSILFTKFKSPELLNILNMSAAVAVAMALENLHQLTINLKWPNDVLVNGKKIAGILTESITRGNSIERVVVGIGLNVNETSFTGKFNLTPTSIRTELKKHVVRERILSEFLNIFEEVYNTLLENPQKILNEWRNRSKYIGEKISISDNKSSRYGIFLDIDDDGALLLKEGDKISRINYGDISLGNG